MNSGPQQLSPESFDAVVLAGLAFILAALCWGLASLLSWCMATADLRDRQAAARLAGTSSLARVLFVSHLLNMAGFVFVKSGWQDLARWQERLLPDRANALVMMFSYLMALAICKITWRDLQNQARMFTGRKAKLASS